MVILGIDPGTANIGYALIEIEKSEKSEKLENSENSEKLKKEKNKKRNNFKCLDFGLIETSIAFSQAERLKKINKELLKLIKKYQPEVLSIENIYFFRNLKTVIPVSQAKGVILMTAAQKKIPVYEFTPLEVKMTITGYGWAEKNWVKKKIKTLFKLKEIPKSDDTCDALAIALTYYFKQFKIRK